MTADNNVVLIIGNMASRLRGTLSVSEELQRLLEARGWRVFIASGKLGKVSRMIDMLWMAFHNRNHYRVALVEVYGELSFIWSEAVSNLLKMLGKPFILALYGGSLPNFARVHPHRMTRLLQSADAVIAPSRYLQEQMKPYRNDIQLLRYGVDLSEFTYRLRAKAEPRLVTLRAVHEIYNPSLAPRVLARILPHFLEADLVMMGPDEKDGSWEKTLNIAAQLGVSGKVHMLGMVPRPQVGPTLHEADIYLNTPNIDNTPLSVTEAMACGLCVVSTNVGGLPYILRDGENVLLVPSDDEEAMAQAVLRILRNPSLAERLSRNARAEAEQYDWSIVLPRWEALFHVIEK